MKNMFSWLISILAVAFWIFRVVVTYMKSMGYDIPYEVMDLPTEIAVLFISFISIVLVFGRKLIGGVMYFTAYMYYFGLSGWQQFKLVLNNPYILTENPSSLISFAAVFLAISILIDLIVNKDRHELSDNKNTYWFYKNKKYDRKLDERADKNQYRTR